jgi:hypothetical protein
VIKIRVSSTNKGNDGTRTNDQRASIKLQLRKAHQIRKSKVLKRPMEITMAKNERKDCQPRQIDEQMCAERRGEESLWHYARQRR